jgi:hypothetical protein
MQSWSHHDIWQQECSLSWTPVKLLINLTAGTDKDLGDVNIILCQHNRGSDAILCKKTREKVVKSLDLKILAGNISHLLTSTAVAE